MSGGNCFHPSEIRCPKCGEKLEFDLSDLANAKDSEDDE